jgi:hypothetical protein
VLIHVDTERAEQFRFRFSARGNRIRTKVRALPLSRVRAGRDGKP